MSDILPSVIFASCTADDPDKLVKLILGEVSPNKTENGITMYDWHISTKYYDADVYLCTMKEKSLSTCEFASSVEGVILFFDPESPRGLAPVNEWMTYLGEYEAEVKLLVCNTCSDNEKSIISKLQIHEWCVKEAFELVELLKNPDDSEGWECEEDFTETAGIERVVQALHAHVWPNLVLKERKYPTTMAGLWHGGFCQSTISQHDDNSIQLDSQAEENSENVIKKSNLTLVSGKKCQDNIEPTLDELLSSDNTDFCDLFSQLPMMKERASSMASEQRKKFAEDVVLAYWKAIGEDDDDEILDC